MGVRFIAVNNSIVPGDIKLIEKTITENGTYNAVDDNANGYSEVTVNVEGGGTSYATLFDGEVTTVDDGEIISGDIGINISGSPLKITFDGVEYTCEQEYDFYGGFDGDYSVYPFCIYTDGFIKTQTAGTHTLKIEAPQSGGSTYHAEVEWDYEAWTGRIISGSYESLMAVYNDYKNPIIHVTLTNYEGDTYTGEAVGVIVDGADIINFCFPKNFSMFIWTPSNEFSCQD